MEILEIDEATSGVGVAGAARGSRPNSRDVAGVVIRGALEKIIGSANRQQ